jgi:hypothetical protein
VDNGKHSPSILIVGAGAQGVITGYHLSLAGASVTFLVREHRRLAFPSAQNLYCYDDASVKTFTGYGVVGNLAGLAGRHFDYALVTLDGASCRSDEGTRLLTGIGDLVRNDDTIVIAGGVGVHDHFVKTTRLPEARILEGTLGCLAYQTDRVTLPLHPPTDPLELAKTTFAYHHFSNRVGFMLAAQPRGEAERFAALHSKSGVSKGIVMGTKLFGIMSTAFFPMTAMCDLAGWPDAQAMSVNRSLMMLGSAAMREVISLPQHGWWGRLASPLMRKATLAMLLKKMEQDSLPLDFHAFNRFHHGGKVREQDIQVMKDCIASGAAARRGMTRLRQLVERYEEHCAGARGQAGETHGVMI